MKRFKFLAVAALGLAMAAPLTLSAQDFRDYRRDHERIERARREHREWLRHHRHDRDFRR